MRSVSTIFIAFLRTLAVAAMLGSLGACATPFRADVARFERLPAPQGPDVRDRRAG